MNGVLTLYRYTCTAVRQHMTAHSEVTLDYIEGYNERDALDEFKHELATLGLGDYTPSYIRRAD